MGKLSTHVLDIAHGRPGAGVKVALFSVAPEGKVLLKMDMTNSDGRCSSPLLEGDSMKAGQYELVFNAGDYFAAQGVGAALAPLHRPGHAGVRHCPYRRELPCAAGGVAVVVFDLSRS